MLALALVMGAMYLWEHMAVLLNGGAPELFPGRNPVGAVFMAAMIAGNVVLPQLFWFRSLRTNPLVIVVVALGVLAGMWMERFWIVVDSLKRPCWRPMRGLLSQPDGPGHDGRKRGPVYGPVHDHGTRHALLFPV